MDSGPKAANDAYLAIKVGFMNRVPGCNYPGTGRGFKFNLT